MNDPATTDQDELIDFLDRAGKEVKPLGPPSLFHHFGQGLGDASMQGFARIGRGAAIIGGGAIAFGIDKASEGIRAAGDALGALQQMASPFGQAASIPDREPITAAQDWVFGAAERYTQAAVDYWAPNANNLGTAGQVVNGLATGLVPLTLGPAGLVATTQADTAIDVSRAGGTTTQSVGAGAVIGAVTAAGVRMPNAFGTSLPVRIATGAAANVALDAGGQVAAGQIVAGNQELERRFEVTGQSVAISALMGGVFGTLPDGARAATTAERDAALTVNNGDHFTQRTMPGEPATRAAAVAHQDALATALQQAMRGEPVNVTGVVNPSTFAMRPEIKPADHYGQMLVVLESGGRADAKASTSSATGLHQFTSATWLRTVRASAPKWAEGLSDAELLALRTDPAKSAEMELALRARNAAALARAGLDDADPFNLYAAHHFGEAGGVKFGKAADDTPMSAILTEGQLNANPYLRGMTKAEAVANWTERTREAGVEVPAVGRAADEWADIPARFPDDTTATRLPDDAPRPLDDAMATARADDPGDYQRWADDLLTRLDGADRSASRTSAFGIQIDRRADGAYHLTDTRDHANLSDDAQFIGPGGETLDRAAATAFLADAASEANRRRAAAAPPAPRTAIDEARQLLAETPDAQAIAGFDLDHAPTYRPMAEVLAEIEAEHAAATRDASAFLAAASCGLRNGYA